VEPIMDREYLLDKATQYLELAAAPSVSPENVAFLRELAVSCFELANRAASDTGMAGDKKSNRLRFLETDLTETTATNSRSGHSGWT
jgi:hypothetical protein